jgi:hypothetical protein
MNPKVKKILIFSGLALDVAIIVFLFVVSIIMLATMPDVTEPGFDMKAYYEAHPGMITYFQANPTPYLLICVVPLIVLLIGNIILLVWYINKAGKSKAQLSDLSEEQKAALRAELMKDMSSEEKKEE